MVSAPGRADCTCLARDCNPVSPRVFSTSANGNADLAELSYVRHRTFAVADMLEHLAGDVLALGRR